MGGSRRVFSLNYSRVMKCTRANLLALLQANHFTLAHWLEDEEASQANSQS